MADKNKKVVLYALSTCGWCRKTKNLLSQLSINYQCFDVDLLKGEEREKILQELKKYNANLSFPTLVIDDQIVIIGYDEEKIKKELT
ncbi:MAG: glutaredoxin family protein [candidate division WOR-3 bacterium]|nr:glutaredoxin family protein [candidate division WOR-3 bacterium]MCX7837477.1 glutaredoxin family protein [candidate division WOR-3 bacterium]